MRISHRCDLSFVAAAFNEAENLPQLAAEWDAALGATGLTYEMVLVDDGSTDGSRELLDGLLQRYARLRGLCMQRRSGQSAALAAGFAAVRGDWIVTADADLQNDPADLFRMLELRDEFDMICGWRKERRDGWLKRWASRVANAARRRLLDDGVHDTGCGLKLFRRAIAERIVKFDGMHRFLPTLAKLEGFTIGELVVHHRPRQRGESKYGVLDRIRQPIADLRGVAWLRARQLHYSAQELSVPEARRPRESVQVRARARAV